MLEQKERCSVVPVSPVWQEHSSMMQGKGRNKAPGFEKKGKTVGVQVLLVKCG